MASEFSPQLDSTVPSSLVPKLTQWFVKYKLPPKTLLLLCCGFTLIGVLIGTVAASQDTTPSDLTTANGTVKNATGLDTVDENVEVGFQEETAQPQIPSNTNTASPTNTQDDASTTDGQESSSSNTASNTGSNSKTTQTTTSTTSNTSTQKTTSPTPIPTTAPAATSVPAPTPGSTTAPTASPITSRIYVTALIHQGNKDYPVYRGKIKVYNMSDGGTLIGEGLTNSNGVSPNWYAPANTNITVYLYKPDDYVGPYCGSKWSFNTGVYGNLHSQTMRLYEPGSTPCYQE